MTVQPSYVVSVAAGAGPAVEHGVELLVEAMSAAGMAVQLAESPLGERITRPALGGPTLVVIGDRATPAIAELEQQEWLLYNNGEPGVNGYYVSVLPGHLVVVTGGDSNGVLYGCQELARVITDHGEIPLDLEHGETPDLALRGPAIGLQLTEVEAPRQVYEYPITPARFPWFYDTDHWLEVLETLLEQRANALYLWSGHPFSSFVSLPDYPEALEVTEKELATNREVLGWLATEAERRGVRVFMKFYNIHIPLPFSQHHGIPLRQPKPTELVSGYTQAAIAAFVADFPQVGLYVCLGEVLQGDLYGAEWFTETILPGIEAGIERAGVTEPPPVLLRAHALDPKPVIDATGDRYPALHTEAKYNGESLTTWNPRGKWQDLHQYLASLGGIHVINIHILSDLEPFRYGSVTFIRRSVQAIRHRLLSHGLHLYPMFYWDWPVSPDRAEPRLRQLDRDWLWFAAWHRYAWKSDRDPAAEQHYWTQCLAEQFGSEAAGAAALATYEAMGEVAPRLLRRVGITEGNRQTFSLGMTLSQLGNPHRHRAWDDLWASHAPAGERLEEFVAREIAGEPHVGETPLDVIEQGRAFSEKALTAVESGLADVTRNQEEYARLRSDAQAIALIAEHYDLRVRAAIEIVHARSEHGGDYASVTPRLRTAIDLVERSVEVYRELAELTAGTYLYANSMRTPQRKIPFPNGKDFGHWQQCLPMYEAELANLRANTEILEQGGTPGPVAERTLQPEPFRELDFTVHTPEVERFEVREGAELFPDATSPITRCALELEGLSGVRFNKSVATEGQMTIDFTMPADGHLLVGYFKEKHPRWLQVPDLETNTHADDRGGLTPVLIGALSAEWHPIVDVHAFRYEAGRHTFAPGAGGYVILGAVAADQEFTGRSVLMAEAETDTLDWLYEEPR